MPFPYRAHKYNCGLTLGNRIWEKGEVQVTVAHYNQVAKLPLLVVQGDGPSLFGKSWLRQLRLDWSEIKVTTEYPGLLKDGLGTIKHYEVKLAVKLDAVPKIFKARSVLGSPHCNHTKT